MTEFRVPSSKLKGWAVGLLALAAVTGVAGATWDAAWHVTLRRESFWSPPHLLLYAGTTLALVAGLAGTAPTFPVQSSRFKGQRGPYFAPFPLNFELWGFPLVALGAFVVIASAPLDELWHRTFGPDVDVWSFPHLVALAGGAAINVGSLAATRAHLARAPGWVRGALQALFLTALLWLAMFSLNWYTLVLARARDSAQYPALASLLAAPVLVLAAWALGRGGATLVAALYMGYAVGAFSGLAALGYAHLPFPPVLIAPALAVDALFWGAPRRRWTWEAAAGLVFAPTFLLAEWASLTWFPHPVLPPARTELALGYFAAAAERPWELAPILAGLPLSMAAGTAGGVFGGWVAAQVGRASTADAAGSRAAYAHR